MVEEAKETVEFTDEYDKFQEDELSEKLEIKEGKYLLSPNTIVNIFIGLLHLGQIQNLKGSQIKRYALKNRDLMKNGIKTFLNDLIAKGEVEKDAM